MGHASRGEYLHFRCDQHKADEGVLEVGRHYSYFCAICGKPAKAYWYRGEQFQTLKMATYSEWLGSVCG